MSYSQGGLIEATDYNGFVSSVNALWGTGSGDSGYGQTSTLSTVSVTNTVTATQWATLISRIDSMRQHQSGVATGIGQPTTGDTIEYINTLSSEISTITTNRLDRDVGVSSAESALASVAWNDSTPVEADVQCTFTWGSANQMRYFFNAGGTVTFNAVNSSFSGTTKASDWDSIANNLATQTVDADIFYNTLGTGFTTLGSASGSGADYGSNVLYLQAKINASAGSSTVLTLRGYFVDGSADSFNDSISGTARIDANANAPATTYLSNTWGTITGADSTVATSS